MEGESRPAVVVKKQKQRIRETAYKNLARDDLIVAVTPYECTLSLSWTLCSFSCAFTARSESFIEENQKMRFASIFYLCAKTKSSRKPSL